MLFLRSLLFNIISNIVLIFVILLSLLTFFLPFNYRYNILSSWAKFNVWWLNITCGISYKVIGRENIPSTPCVVLSNHQSTWDTFIFQLLLPPQTWVLKKELLFIPVFGWGLALLKPITINRADKLSAIRKVIAQGVNRLQQGIWVIIYPEGTRQPYAKLGKYQNGGVAMAQKAGVDILPIYHNAGKFWPKGSFIKTPGEVVITIGKVIPTSADKPKTITTNVENWALNLQQEYTKKDNIKPKNN